MAEQRRKFPREFKVEAVRRVIDSGETTTEVARAIVFECIEIWYNRQRRHSTLGYVSPEQFEKNQAA